jgi:hypothetical protein
MFQHLLVSDFKNRNMKKLLLLFILSVIASQGFSQVSESKSGVKTFNISKKGNDLRTLDESKANSDVIPPRISLQSPAFGKDSVLKTSTKTLIVKGKVEDTGGIFEVVVNGIEAKVATDGIFQAEIPIAFGRNTVTINATDVSFNRSALKFYSERLTSQITEPVAAAPVKPVNKYSITVTSPSSDNFTTATDKFILKACVKATSPIKKIMISRDGTFVNGFLSNNIVQRGDCSFLVEEPVSLKLGLNDIKIEVYAADDTISKMLLLNIVFMQPVILPY